MNQYVNSKFVSFQCLPAQLTKEDVTVKYRRDFTIWLVVNKQRIPQEKSLNFNFSFLLSLKLCVIWRRKVGNLYDEHVNAYENNVTHVFSQQAYADTSEKIKWCLEKVAVAVAY